ncbi:MAG: MBL fold metallo-hydrolase, partial [Acidimicrobiaceae bacterium]|nr:MBL fold metallo-hydrolase [Acidimicrobiaceae bacterium]
MAIGESKDASSHTVARNRAAASRVPDPADLERVQRGHIASLSSSTIESSEGRVVFNVGAYDFLRTGDPSPDTVNPNL